MFKKNKNIELIKFHYNSEFLFSNAFVIIEYNFSNALWYSFNNQNTLEKNIKIFNLENINSSIDFIVFGFFRKRKFSINLNPTLKLESQNFKTSSSNLSLKLNDYSIPILNSPAIEVSTTKIDIKTSSIHFYNKPLTVQHNNYNQNEFI